MFLLMSIFSEIVHQPEEKKKKADCIYIYIYMGSCRSYFKVPNPVLDQAQGKKLISMFTADIKEYDYQFEYPIPSKFLASGFEDNYG